MYFYKSLIPLSRIFYYIILHFNILKFPWVKKGNPSSLGTQIQSLRRFHIPTNKRKPYLLILFSLCVCSATE